MTIKKSKIDIRVAMHMRVYVMLCKRGPIVVFIADSKRSRSAEKECQLSLLEQTKIDQAKNDQESQGIYLLTLFTKYFNV